MRGCSRLTRLTSTPLGQRRLTANAALQQQLTAQAEEMTAQAEEISSLRAQNQRLMSELPNPNPNPNPNHNPELPAAGEGPQSKFVGAQVALRLELKTENQAPCWPAFLELHTMSSDPNPHRTTVS